MSDTHGYEATLTDGRGDGDDNDDAPVGFGANGADAAVAAAEAASGGSGGEAGGEEEPSVVSPLPVGDVLIHGGDFQIDASTRPRDHATSKFDRWLAAQPATTKIIVRGNHDVPQAVFPQSKAKYVVRPTVVDVRGLKIGIVPFSRGRLREPLPPCDVFVTHVPPRGVLDKCYNGDRAGSRFLRDAVVTTLLKPRVWLCGHIHEGFGHESVRFGSGHIDSTLVVNGANANAGRANRLVRGAVVLDIPLPAPGSTRGFSISTSGASDDGAGGTATTTSGSGGGGLGVGMERRLLAVDLGLRTGLALFDSAGRLLSYSYRKVESALELGDLAEEILSGRCDLEEELASAPEGEAGAAIADYVISAPEGKGAAAGTATAFGCVTNVAIEGRDLDLKGEWEEAARRAAERTGRPAATIVEVRNLLGHRLRLSTHCRGCVRIATDCLAREGAPAVITFTVSRVTLSFTGEPRGVAQGAAAAQGAPQRAAGQGGGAAGGAAGGD